jgi:putative membrane protein
MRPALAWLGLLVLAAAWVGVPGLLLPPFSAHMTMHMAVVAVAAPLIAFGVAGGAFDPALRWPRLVAVVPASIVELLLVWGWHTPALHHAARSSVLAVVLEQGSFLTSGLWLWSAAVGGKRPGQADLDRSGAGILALLLTSMHMTLLGALLALPPRALYDHHGTHHHGPVEAHGRGQASWTVALSPLEDQHLGGAIMIVFGGASYLAGASWLSVGLLRRRRSGARELAVPAASAAGTSGRGGS